ncbi:MAG: hypothetical protein M0R06_10075, partial [Sphaerochaeta sp.]|nr:hypothetical protein [Sphaerochaeta sp.]
MGSNEFDLEGEPENPFEMQAPTDPENEGPVVCPNCAKVLDHVVQYGKSWGRSCPYCGISIRKELMPDNFPVEVQEPKRKRKGTPGQPVVSNPAPSLPQGFAAGSVQKLLSKARPVDTPQVAQPQTAYQEPVDDRPGVQTLFKTPRTPTDVLVEVCTLHGLNEQFIQYAARKSMALQDGLQPMEFMSMLKDLKSGMTSKAQAEYIVGDYNQGLMDLRIQQAEEQSRGMYPHVPSVDQWGRPIPQQMPNVPGQARSRGFDPRDMSNRLAGAIEQNPQMSPQQIFQMMQEAMEADRREREAQQMREDIINIRNEMKSSIQELAQGTLEAIRESTKPAQVQQGVTIEQIQLMLSQQRSEADKTAMQNQLDMMKQMNQLVMAQLQSNNDRLSNERNELLKQLELARRDAVPGQRSEERRVG